MNHKHFSTFLILAALLALMACGGKNQESGKVQPISHPELTGLEPQALQKIEAQKQKLANILVKTDASDRDKADAFGLTGVLYQAYSYRPAAITAYQNAHLLDPESLQWPYLLAHVYRDENDPAKALENFELSHSIQADSPAVKIALADAYRFNNENDKAQKLYEEALALDENTVGARMGLGHLLAAKGEHQQAIEQFAKVLASQARASAVHYPMALSYQALGNADEAQKHMSLRGEIEPYQFDPILDTVNRPRYETHYRMAETLRIAGQNETAIPHYDLVVQLMPTEAGPRLARALNLIKMDRHYEAVVNLQDDLTVFPNLTVLHHMLARLSATSPDERVRDGKRSLRILNQLQKAGRTAELTETLAMALAEIDRFDDALAAQQEAIKLAKQSGDEDFTARLAAAMDNYKNKQKIRVPWTSDDPIFKMLTYGK